MAGDWPRRSFAPCENEFTEFLQISVSDDGIGIAEEGLERLFQPFSQIDSGLARKFEGTGLGLAMVKLLAELHGGTVAMQSAAGEGSCVTVWLPMRTAEELHRLVRDPEEAPPAAAHHLPHRERISSGTGLGRVC